jgi:c-di-GMP-binding flagellar brake protein YcgR
MPLFGKKTANSKCAQQLQTLAEENVIVEMQLIEPDGRIGATGKTRIRAFDRAANVVKMDVPSKSGRPITIGEGDSIRVFIIQPPAVYKFDSVLIGREVARMSAGDGLSLLCVEAPEQLENGNRRRHFRVTPISNAPVIIQWRVAPSKDSKVDRPWNKCRVNDLSGRGAGLLIEPALAESVEDGHRLQLRIQMPASGANETIPTYAVVRRVVPSPDGERSALLGVEFEVESRDPSACIEQVVSYVTFCQIEMARAQRERES